MNEFKATREEHIKSAPNIILFVEVTVSTSRYEKKLKGKKVLDISGDYIEKAIKKSGYKLIFRDIIPDDREKILDMAKKWIGKTDVIVFSGGTGLSKSDITVDAIREIAEKEVQGFGEIFRALSYKEIGVSAILSRASAFIISGTIVFCLPGSPNAVKLAFDKIILPEIRHIVYHVKYD